MTDTSWIRKQRWSDRDKYALPFNLELNLSDIRRIWNWEADPVSTITSRNLMRPGRASIRYETNLENMRGLLKELIFAIRAMGRDRAMKETRFEERWSRLDSDCLLLRAVWGQNPKRLNELDEEYRQVTTDAHFVLEDSKPPRSRAGAKPKYDWAAAEGHVRKLFEHHGPLSPDDREWSKQADVERALAEFFQSTVRREPAESVLRKRASEFIRQIEAGI